MKPSILLMRSESGSILTVALGAVAVVGVLSFSAYNLLLGPVRSTATVSAKTKAYNDAQIAARLIMNQADDNDGDGVVEPIAPDATGTYPTGGGVVPAAVGAAPRDPWGTAYGYCGWNHGATNTGGGTVLDGATTGYNALPYVAVLSAGPDRSFDTTCTDVANGTTVGDDVVTRYIYETAMGGGGGDKWSERSAGVIEYANSDVNIGSIGLPVSGNDLRVQDDVWIGGDLSVIGSSSFGDTLVIEGDLNNIGLGANVTAATVVAQNVVTRQLSGVTDTTMVNNLSVGSVDNMDLETFFDFGAASYTNTLNEARFPTVSGGVSRTAADLTVVRLQGINYHSDLGGALSTGAYFTWDSGTNTWVSSVGTTPGGDVTGDMQNLIVSGLQGRTILAGAPGANNVLGWNGTQWAPMAIGATGSATVIEFGGVNFLGKASNITSALCSSKQIPKYDGTNWNCAADAIGAAPSLPINFDEAPVDTERVAESDDTLYTFIGARGYGNYYMGIGAGQAQEAVMPEHAALSSTDWGSGLIALGYRAGYTYPSLNSTIIGSYAGENARVQESVLVGFRAGRNLLQTALTDDSNVADDAGKYLTIIGSNAGAASTAGYHRTTIIGANAGQSLNGGDYNTLVGYRAGNALVGAERNTIFGYQAGENLTGGDNIFIGNLAGQNAVGSDNNVVIGAWARAQQPGTSANNVIIGHAAGYLVNSAIYNIFIGADAGRSAFTSSIGNIAIGHQAWYDDQHSRENIAIGYRAGRYRNYAANAQYNIYIGANAGRGAATGSETTTDFYIGYNAGLNAHRSSYNVFIGHQAGEFFRTTAAMSLEGGGTGADGNTVIGANAGRGASVATPFSGSENVFVGYNAGMAATTAAWNVIIGANTGTTMTTGKANILLGAGAELPTATTDDYFKLGTSRVADVLYGSMVTGNLTLKGTLTQLSDVRLKREIKPLSSAGSAMAKIKKLNGVIYRWKPTKIKPDDRDYLGLIAQDVKKVLPQVVFKQGDSEVAKYYTVDYRSIVPLLVDGVNEQEDQLLNLEDKADYLLRKRKGAQE